MHNGHKPTFQAPWMFLPALNRIHITGPKAIGWQDFTHVFRRMCVISAMYSGTIQLIGEICNSKIKKNKQTFC